MGYSPLRIEVLRDANDATVLVSGSRLTAPVDQDVILDISQLRGEPKALKLTDVTFAIEKGLCLYLWWDDGKGDTLILPLNEGQGKLDFESFGGLQNPRRDNWTGHVELSSSQPKGVEKNFTLVLGFAKVRE